MKTRNISHPAAFIIALAILSSSVLAGPGPQTPPSSPKSGNGKKIMALHRPKMIAPTTGPKSPVLNYPRPRVLTAGQGSVTVWQ